MLPFIGDWHTLKNLMKIYLDDGLREMAHLFYQVILARVVSETFLEFKLMLYTPVNSYGNVGRLLPFYGTLTQNKDVMTLKICSINITTQLSQNHPTKPNKAYMYGWFD